jgi:hypothetical protein
MNLPQRLRSAAALVAVCLAGGATEVAVASDGGRGLSQTTDDHTTTTGETTTGTTGETTTGTTGESTTGSTTTPTGVRRPRILDLEADAVSNRRLRLRAEISRRGSRLTSVRFVYRGRTYRARRSEGEFTRIVTARGGDRRGDVITFRVRACSGSLCVTRTGRDEAGG